MYGLIHRALREMAIREVGVDRWRELSAAVEIDESDMISAKVYADETTLRLVGAVSSEMGISPEQMLERFGIYWVEFAGASAYGPMLNLAGDNLVDCLRNLDRLHSGIQLTLPDASLPSFAVLQVGPDFVKVLYTSRRVGLEAFVKGLLEGLLLRFRVKGDVIALGPSDLGVVFHVSFSQ